MLSARKFAANLNSIRKADDAFRALVAESLAFAIFHARNHGQKTPFMQLQDACPGWLQKHLKSVALGKKKISETEAEYEASFRVSEWFATHEQAKAIRNANRKTRTPKTTPEVSDNVADVVQDDAEDTIIEGVATIVANEDALLVHGEAIDLSADEAVALMQYLAQLRTPQLKVVNG